MLLAACGQSSDDAQPMNGSSAQRSGDSLGSMMPGGGAMTGADATAVERVRDSSEIRYGAKLFQGNCATCHGDHGQGATNWRHRGPDGKFPPPPLNGTGHAWHHPLKMLKYVIKNGSPGGQGNMPAWKDRLSDKEIDAIIAWFQSQWPDQVYNAWYEINQRSMQ
jgi:mono/diheme cytochrome c family protein